MTPPPTVRLSGPAATSEVQVNDATTASSVVDLTTLAEPAAHHAADAHRPKGAIVSQLAAQTEKVSVLERQVKETGQTMEVMIVEVNYAGTTRIGTALAAQEELQEQLRVIQSRIAQLE
ncbi:hypothetical protein H257_14729 [Aphanomyces astaci]|uniref:Uncharacterized protein n=1 Tax=Aphanomyces astaci TaxID=112090 RepID=W4FQ44_APHAT|nr:hypothetical protein H257_14729 [Aphanomyces astaci]ETV69590.1 hypothetical protein H257_14729 [Aphanomyces astaci]|eukprot:XP_009840917.1 hypothetical protein H257_14729 [Aphanomyces astaci]